MFESLLRQIQMLSPEELANAYLEEMAICRAWYASYEGNEEERAPFNDIPERIQAWLKCAVTPNEPTEGHRQQPLLRRVIKAVVQGELSEMQRDELDFLHYAWELSHQVDEKISGLQRSIRSLKPFIAQLQKLREKLELNPGLPALELRMGLVTADDLRKAQTRDIRVFGGIALTIRGPVYFSKGDIKVVGNVPEDCTLVVEGGSAYVSGMVQGNIAVSESCEVFGNVSGVIVARRGDVRGMSLLSPSTVISKEGSVHFRESLEPRLVFGCKKIRIRGNATGGNYYGRVVEIGDTFTSGELHVSEVASANLFCCSETRKLVVLLRRGLSYRDYGEVLTQESNRLLSNAMKLRQSIANIRLLLDITEREADEYAGNVILFLLGSDKTQEQVEQIQRLRRRNACLNRLLAAGRSLAMAIEDRIGFLEDSNGGMHESQSSPFGSEERTLLDELEKELMHLASEGVIERDLYDERDEILHLGRLLLRKMLTPKDVIDTLNLLLAKIDDLELKKVITTEHALQIEETVERAVGRAAIIDRAKTARARVEVLGQLLSECRKRGVHESFRDRVNDRYVNLMRRNIEMRLSRMGGYRLALREIEDRAVKIREKLWDEFQVSLPLHVIEGEMLDGARIVGCFDTGVKICIWKHLMDAQQDPHGGLCYTENTEDIPVTYQRSPRGIVERIIPEES